MEVDADSVICEIEGHIDEADQNNNQVKVGPQVTEPMVRDVRLLGPDGYPSSAQVSAGDYKLRQVSKEEADSIRARRKEVVKRSGKVEKSETKEYSRRSHDHQRSRGVEVPRDVPREDKRHSHDHQSSFRGSRGVEKPRDVTRKDKGDLKRKADFNSSSGQFRNYNRSGGYSQEQSIRKSGTKKHPCPVISCSVR